MPSCDKRLPPDTWNRSWSQENAFANPHSTQESSQTPYRGIHQFATPSAAGEVPVLISTGHLLQERKNELETQSQCRHLQAGRQPWDTSVLWIIHRFRWCLDSKDSRYRNFNLINFLLILIFGLEDKIQKPSDYLFLFSFGGNVMDHRSGNGWFFGRVEILAISLWKGFSKFWDAGREDRLWFEQDHPEPPKPFSITLIYFPSLFATTMFRNSILDGTKI